MKSLLYCTWPHNIFSFSELSHLCGCGIGFFICFCSFVVVSVFPDNPRVSLPESLYERRCSGEVQINDIKVCSDHWDDQHSQIVCQQKDCGHALFFKQHGRTGSDVYHVRCLGSESSLGQCETVLGRCDGGLVSVYCSGECFYIRVIRDSLPLKRFCLSDSFSCSESTF